MAAEAERKRVELSIKLDALDAELDRWLEVTAPGAALEKHHTQLRRVSGELKPLLSLVRASATADEVARDWRRIERETLDLHRVWDFYREKLALRFVPWLRDYLLMADEYAWAGYQPAQVAAVRSGAVAADAVREPPLVSLSSVASPFSISRGSSLAAEVHGVGSARASALIEALPIPVIGVPWYQLRHLPDALITGHEVGHLVLSDFALAATAAQRVDTALAATGPAVRARWSGWLEEVFCDVYGALAGGPAYPLSLGDFLLVGGVDPTTDGNREYPPSAVRLATTIAAVGHAQCPIDDLVERFDGVLGVLAPDLRRQADLVAEALVSGTFPSLGGPLTQILDPRTLWPAQEEATSALQGWPLRTTEIRTLVATAAYVFSARPQSYRDIDMAGKVLQRARDIQQPGVRFRAGGAERDDDAVAAADAAGTVSLYEILSGAACP